MERYGVIASPLDSEQFEGGERRGLCSCDWDCLILRVQALACQGPAACVCLCSCGGCRAGRMLCMNVLSDATTAAAL